MMRQSGHRRAGFTLIELLVVIFIILVLMGLLLSGVMAVLRVGSGTETRGRMEATSKGIGAFQSHGSFGKVNYIPPGAYDPVNRTWGPFRLRNTYPRAGTATAGEPDEYSFEAKYLQSVFGRDSLNLADLGYPGLRADLDANQALTFFLGGIPETDGQGNAAFTGFSTNKAQPFRRRQIPDEARIGPILDLGGKRKYALDPQNGFPRMTDDWGTPFLYFAAYEGKKNAYYGNGGYNPLSPATRPYSRNGQFENPSGFQIISAGADRQFGVGGNWVGGDRAGENDLGNFSKDNLGSVP